MNLYDDRVQTAIRLAKNMLVESIWTSAHIEGYKTTFDDTEEIIYGNEDITAYSNEMLFIIGMRDAWQFLLENVDAKDNLLFIRELNTIYGHYLIHGCGEVRTTNVYIKGSSYVPHIPTTLEILADIDKINEIVDPVRRAIVYFCYLCKKQIFIDGNKRIAQLMCNKVLIENGIGIMSIPVRWQDDWYKFLLEFYETGKSTNLIRFIHSKCLKRV